MRSSDPTRRLDRGEPPASGARPRIPPGAEQVFRQALPFVLALARGHGFELQGQLDVAQDTGVRIVEHIGEYDPERGTVIQWALGIARNVIRRTSRARRTERRFFVDGPAWDQGDRSSPDLTPEEKTRALDTIGAINGALTEEQRAICELAIEGYTAVEIGEIMGLRPVRVEQRIREARARLDALLRRLGEDEESVTRVRGMVPPFVMASDMEAALRAGRVPAGLADELWKGVVERVRRGGGGEGGGGGSVPPDGPSPEDAAGHPAIETHPPANDVAPPPASGAPGAGARTPGREVHPPLRAPRLDLVLALSALVSALLFVTAMHDGTTSRPLPSPAGPIRQVDGTGAAEPDRALVVPGPFAPAAEASSAGSAHPGRPASGRPASMVPSSSTSSAPPGASPSSPAPGARGNDADSEDRLIRRAKEAVATNPALSIALLHEHERRFPRRNAELRRWLLAQASRHAQPATLGPPAPK